MKTMFRLLVAAFALSLASTFAADLATNTAAGLNGLLGKGARLHSVQVVNGTTNAITVHLFDAPTTGTLKTTYTNAAFTVISQGTPQAVVTTYTNVFGAVETWTNRAISSTVVTNAASTNNYPRLATFVVAGSGTAVWTPAAPTFVTLGLLSSNTAAATLNINYSR